jgi:hypothetical protein
MVLEGQELFRVEVALEVQGVLLVQLVLFMVVVEQVLTHQLLVQVLQEL